MNKNEYLKKLGVFKDFKFFEEDHHYEYKGKRVGISVTRLIEEYTQPFNTEEVAQKVALKNNKTIDEILNEWSLKNSNACLKGQISHDNVQNMWSGINSLYDIKSTPEVLQNSLQTIFKQELNFYNDFRNKFKHLAYEFVIGSEEYDIASAIDHLFINLLTGGLVMIDYKTNTDIHKGEKFAKYMQWPLNHLKDTKLNHYAMQLSIYKFILEKYTGLKLEDMFIVWFSEENENYEIIEAPYLEKEVKKILELRRTNKMAKMILVMGEPASGKTVSLRNIPKNELYYIDCDKKGLNYKGWKTEFNEEKKNYCRTNDGEAVKKILKGISETREDIKYIAIDTINSIMIADEMVRMKGKNYNEWQDLAKCIFELIDIVPDLRDDLTIIFMGHTQTDESGFTRLLTNGRKLNKIGLEKYFDTVLISKNNDGNYVFETTSSVSTARVPMGSFDGKQYIENDLYEVIKELKEF